jgi:hypothetical protein
VDFCNKIYQTVHYDTRATITNQKLKLYNNEKYLLLEIAVSRDTVHYYQVSVCQIVSVAENFVARRHCQASHCHSCTLKSVRYNAFQCYSLFLMSVLCLIWNITIFRCIPKIAKKQLFTLSCLSVCPYGTFYITLVRFSWNFYVWGIFENLLKKYKFH